MNRGEVWLAEVGRKKRPVLVLTRPEVIDVRALVTVAEVTTMRRGLAFEVDLQHADVGLEHPSVINCDGLHTVAKSSLTTLVGMADEQVMDRVCRAVEYAIGC